MADSTGECCCRVNYYHDEYSTYKKLDSIGYKHASVNHSKEFKSKDGVCTNTIEGLWGLMKNKIKVMHGIRQDRLDAYLDEFSYQHYYSCGLSTATIEYSCPSVCLCVCVWLSVCVCVCLCTR